MPVVAYFGDAALARQLRSDADREEPTFDITRWLERQLAGKKPAVKVKKWVDACRHSDNLATLREKLGLDYERFNRALLDLGETPLSKEAELRNSYDIYLEQMRPEIVNRLRRHYVTDFHEGCELDAYVERKKLEFLPFNEEWILKYETLEKELVDAHVRRLLDKELGREPEESRAPKLEPLKSLLERNRDSVRKFVKRASSLVTTWCHRNGVEAGLWQNEDSQPMLLQLENRGLLDFDLVSTDEKIFALYQRAECWPRGMPQTLDKKALRIDQTEEEEYREQKHRQQKQQEIDRRSIEFAGRTLDTEDASFNEDFRQLQENHSQDGAWIGRSGETKPSSSDPAEPSRSGGGPQVGGPVNPQTHTPLTEGVRQAMGWASEWLAFQYLCRNPPHSNVNEDCWGSTNRANHFGGCKGDDSRGYDCHVKTPRAQWFYEVKSSLDDSDEFELTANELR